MNWLDWWQAFGGGAAVGLMVGIIGTIIWIAHLPIDADDA